MTCWLPVRGYEGVYEVSDSGQVRSLPREVWHPVSKTTRLPGRELKPVKHSNGYRQVTLWRAGIWEHRYIHRMVLDAFVGERPELEACHINGVPDDNRLENLCWGTRSDNIRDAVRHGTHWKIRNTHCPQGHPYQGDNLHTETNPVTGRTKRRCKECEQAAKRRWYERNKEKNT